MKRYLLMLSFLCMTVPQTADAESILDTGASFQLAKTVKLGRELIINNTRNAKVGGGSTAICGANCSSCNTTTKQCMQCSDNTYALNNGRCQKCSDTLSNCVQCSSVSVCSKCATGFIPFNNKCEQAFTLEERNSDGSLYNTYSLPKSQISAYFDSYPDVTIFDKNTNSGVTQNTQVVVKKCSSNGVGDFWTMQECQNRLPPGKFCSPTNNSCNANLETCAIEHCKLCNQDGFCDSENCEDGFSGDGNGYCVPAELIITFINSDGTLSSSSIVDRSGISNYFNAQAGVQIFDPDNENGPVSNSTHEVVLKCSGNGLGDFWDEASCKNNLPSGQTCSFSPQNTCQFSRSDSSFPVVIRDTKGTFSTSVENSSSSSIADLAYELKTKYSYTVQSCSANGNQIDCNCVSDGFASKANCEASFAANSGKTCILPYGQNYFCPYFVGDCPANCLVCSAYGTVTACNVCKDGYKINANAGCDRANITVVIRDAKSSISTTVDSSSSSLAAVANELKNRYSGTVQSCSASDDKINCNCVSGAYVSRANCEASFQANTGKTCIFPYGQTDFCPFFAANCNQPNCLACTPSGGTQTACTKCEDGYSLKNNACVSSCSSGSNIHVGIDGTEYCYNTGTCPDDSQSATSQGQKTVCSCKPGYNTAGARCVPTGGYQILWSDTLMGSSGTTSTVSQNEYLTISNSPFVNCTSGSGSYDYVCQCGESGGRIYAIDMSRCTEGVSRSSSINGTCVSSGLSYCKAYVEKGGSGGDPCANCGTTNCIYAGSNNCYCASYGQWACSGGSSSSSCSTHSQCSQGYECSGNGCRVCRSGSNLSMGNCNCPAGKSSTGYGSCQ